MSFPVRMLSATCEISTATLIIHNQPHVFEGEADAMTVDVKFKNSGQDCDISMYLAEMYLFYPSADEMTDAVDMTISGSSASASFPEILTAKGGSPLLVIRIKDPYNGNILTACAAPIRIQNVLGKTVITTRPPTPSEVVYIGRAPYISEESGNWMTWDAASGEYVDTGKPATGPQGEQGIQGIQGIRGVPGFTPYIGENGNWFVGTEDTMIAARGPKGEQGDAAPIPYIGENGNWFVGDTDTGTKAQGPAGANGTGSGTVTGIQIGGNTYPPNESGVVTLPEQEGGGVPDGGTTGQILIKQSDANGDAIWKTLTAQDVGALPSNGTAADSSKLGGVDASNYALKTDISVLDAYPVGSIYMSVSDTDPAILFGGTWVQIKGRFLLGAGSNEANTNTTYGSLAAGTVDRPLGEMGGEAKNTLTVRQTPNHNHKIWAREIYAGGGGYMAMCSMSFSEAEYVTGSAGSGESHNNMPPYLVVYMWQRLDDEEVA